MAPLRPPRLSDPAPPTVGAALPDPPPRGLRERERERGRGEDPPRAPSKEGGLDPLERALYQPQNLLQATAPQAPAPGATSPPPPALDALVDRFLRRVALSGDRRRGVAHLEIGEGALVGGTVTITADHGALELRIDAPPSAEAERWGERVAGRLRARGFEVALSFG